MRTEHQHCAGGIVVREGEVLLIAVDQGRRWQLPKGHIESGETPEEAGVREVREETGVTGHVVAPLPPIEYTYSEKQRRIHKTVKYYLMDYVCGDAANHDPDEVFAARWFDWEEGLARLTFDNERDLVKAARELMQLRSRP